MHLFWKYLCKKNEQFFKNGLQVQAVVHVNAGLFLLVHGGHFLDVMSLKNKNKISYFNLFG
jgi:hypothetical protein